MKKTLLFACFFIFSQIIAQDYLPVPLGSTVYYQTAFFSNVSEANECEDGDCLLGIAIDSVVAVGANANYYFTKGIRAQDNLCESASWLGSKLFLLSTGDQVYSNSYGLPILLKPTTSLGSAWVMASFVDNSFYEATLADRYEEEILGVLDTVVQIQLVRKDQQGNVLTDDFNNKSILMGKNSGFIQTYDFYKFPDDTFPKYLVGYKNPNAHGIVPPTAAEIFDYAVGNEYHYQTYTRNPNLPDSYTVNGFERIIILDKAVSADGDTLTYNLDWTIHRERIGFEEMVTNTRDTFPFDIILSRYAYLNEVPHTPINFSWYYDGYISPYISEGKVFIKTYDYLYYSEDDECFFEFVGSGWFLNRHYAACLGVFGVQDIGGDKSDWMVYYKKGSEEWGTPVDFNALKTNEPLLSSASFSVFPNPVNQVLHITSKDFENEDILIEMFNLDGRQVLVKEDFLTRNTALEIPDIPDGLFVLKISTARGIYIEKVLVSK